MSLRSHNRRHRVDVLVIEALLQQAQGDKDVATAKLIEAGALAQALGLLSSPHAYSWHNRQARETTQERELR